MWQYNLIIVILLLTACFSQTQNSKFEQAVQKENTIIWTGLYKGVLPCAGCNRIELEIQLFDNFNYQMTTQKIGSIQFMPQIVRGKFKWRLDADGLIQLDENGDNMMFFVSQNGKLEMRGNDEMAYLNYKGVVCHLNKLMEQ